jgi:hypothetical protein
VALFCILVVLRWLLTGNIIIIEEKLALDAQQRLMSTYKDTAATASRPRALVAPTRRALDEDDEDD